MITTFTKHRGGSDSHWFLFVLLPLFSAINALKNFRAPWAKNILWAFVVFSGFTFTIGKETMSTNLNAGGADINRYVDEVQDLYGKSLSLEDMISYFQENGEADVLRTTIAIVVSRFTNSQRVLTTVYGFIFGFFFTRNLWYLFDRMKGRLKFFSVLLITSFFLLDSFWEINGFRFYTAVHVFVYGCLPYIYEGKKSLLWVSFCSVLVHFTFLLPVSILLLYIFVGNRSLFYFIFFLLSVFMQQIDLSVFNNFIENNVPELFVERSASYRSEEKVTQYRSEDETIVPNSVTDVVITKNWYANWYIKVLQDSFEILLVFLYMLSKKKIKKIPGLYNAFCFTLLFFSVANIMASLPSGTRFLTIACMLAASVVLIYFQNYSRDQYLPTLMLILTPFFLLFFVVSIRIGFYSIGIQTIVGNPLLGVITDYNLSLNDIIK
jgi:hypothetical protein